MLQLLHARSALCRIGTEHLLVVDPARAEARERLERSAGAPRVGDTRDAGGPRVAHAPLRRAGKLLRGRRVLEGAQRADPAGELALRILAGEVGQLEVGVGVDESGNEAGFRESELPHSRGRGNEWLRSYGGDDAAVVNENGAVLDGRRRDGVHKACTDTQHQGIGARALALGVTTPRYLIPQRLTPVSHGETPMPNGACTGQAWVGSVPG